MCLNNTTFFNIKQTVLRYKSYAITVYINSFLTVLKLIYRNELLFYKVLTFILILNYTIVLLPKIFF